MPLPEHSPPDDSRPTRVIVRCHDRNRIQLPLVDAGGKCCGFFLGRVHVADFTKVDVAGCFLTVGFVDVGKGGRSDSLAPVRLLWDTNKNSGRRSLLQDFYGSGDTGFLARNGTLQYHRTIHMSGQRVVRDQKVTAPPQNARKQRRSQEQTPKQEPEPAGPAALKGGDNCRSDVFISVLN